MKLKDGTIIPSTHRTYRGSDDKIFHDAKFNNSTLRVGSVVSIYYPTHSQNFNKQKTEYEVVCRHSDDNGAASAIFYRCTLASPIGGGVVDYIDYALRDSAFFSKDDGSVVSYGSSVLVLCPNGRSSQAYIVGGATHPLKSPDKAGKGIFYDFEYNGIHINIDNDGAYSLTQLGPSSASGDYDTSNIPGENSTAINIDKQGTVTLSVDDQNIKIDRAASEIQVNAKNKITTDVHGPAITNCSNFQINGTAEAFLKATTYRANEAALHAQLQGYLTAISGLIGGAGGALTAAAPFLLIPVAGPMIASPFVGTAGAILTSIAPLVASMQAAIATFEAAAPTYKSLNHAFSDPSPI